MAAPTDGLNLHALVRASLGVIHPETTALLYRNMGKSTLPDGSVTAGYAPALPVSVQVQSEGDKGLTHSGRVSQQEDLRRFFLCSGAEPDERVAGLVRPLSRGGDLFQLADESWWLVDAVLEDFSQSGWVCVRAVRQVNAPQFLIQEKSHDSE